MKTIELDYHLKNLLDSALAFSLAEGSDESSRTKEEMAEHAINYAHMLQLRDEKSVFTTEITDGQRSANVSIKPSNGHIEIWMSAKNTLYIWVYEQYNPCEVHEFSMPWSYKGGYKGVFNKEELVNHVGSTVVNIGIDSGYIEVYMSELNTLCLYVYNSKGDVVHEWAEEWGKS